MTSGEVEMAVQDSLDDADKANGMILACQAKPTRRHRGGGVADERA
jgi:ferredoxin